MIPIFIHSRNQTGCPGCGQHENIETACAYCGYKYKGEHMAFDLAPTPTIPGGFKLMQAPERLAIVAGPGGEEYYIALNPPRLAPIIRRFPKVTWVDFSNCIPLVD